MDTLEKVCSIVNERFELSDLELSGDTTWEEIGADSIDLVDLISAVEDTFGISIPDEAIENLRSIGDVASYIDSL